MARCSFFATLLLIAAAVCGRVNAFTASSHSSASNAVRASVRLLADKNNNSGGPSSVERGVSVDQDGKSNVWAIEPKVEVETKSSEEKGASALLAGGGLMFCAAAAVAILTNLPDPNQF